jgi:Spy/CpxP family protein refolding chaperone
MNKNTMIHLGLLVAAFALGIVVSGPLHRIVHSGGPFGKYPDCGGPPEVLRLLEKDLDLTGEQSRKVSTIIENNMKRERQFREIIRRALDSNIKVIESESFDENRARTLIRSLSKVEEDIKLIHLKQLHDIRAVLTPSQRARFREIRMRNFPKNGPGGHSECPPGPGPFPGPPMM